MGWLFVCIVLGFSIHQLEYELHRGEEVFWKSPTIPLVEPKTKGLAKEVMGFYPFWMGTAYQSLDYSLLSTIAYFSAEVDSFGNITNLNGWPPGELIDSAHTHNVRVVLVATNFSSTSIRALLAHSDRMANLVDTLLYEVSNGLGDGVCIDFEGVPYASKESLVIFMEMLSDTFHYYIPGSYVTVCTPAVDWLGAFDYDLLAYATDGLMIMAYDYHWSGSDTAGPVAPLSSSDTWGTYSVEWTIQDYITWGGAENRGKFILGVPYYGYEWPTEDTLIKSATLANGVARIYNTAAGNAEVYGKKWDSASSTPWYHYTSNDTAYQCWFDDSVSLSLEYNLVWQETLQGIGIWALGYDGSRTELWGALRASFGVLPPPENFRVFPSGGNVVLMWSPKASGVLYRVYVWNGSAFELLAEVEDTVHVWTPTLSPPWYFRVSTVTSAGEGDPGEVLGTNVTEYPPSVLIVQGYDRTSTGENTFDFLPYHGNSIHSANRSFCSASNEAVINGIVPLGDFCFVDWLLAEEGADDETFDTDEQTLVRDYVNAGGKLLVSGSEIGYDLDYLGSVEDKDFYNTVLGAVYDRDDAGVYTADGVAGTFLEGLTVNFDDGTQGIYDVTYPDAISPAKAFSVGMVYGGTSYGACVFSDSVVYFAFGLEAVYPDDSRDDLFLRVLDWLDVPLGVQDTVVQDPVEIPKIPVGWKVYPNVGKHITVLGEGHLSIYDVSGRCVGRWDVEGRFVWLAEGNPCGVYFFVMRKGRCRLVEKVIVIK